MISEFNDEEILDFLMTSEFEGNYKPDELKYLLFKWRYFYRVLYGKLELSKLDLEKLLEEYQTLMKSSNDEKNNLLVELASFENEVHQLKQRKLTWKERIKGKIINKDEN
jgi:hypothetical protein